MALSDYKELVPVPPNTDINSGLTYCKPSTLRTILGEPRLEKDYGTTCQPVTGPFKPRIVTQSVGPFKVTGLDAAVASLTRIMAAIKNADPGLYAALGTAGMLCCRLIRGSKTNVSNHSWGTAIDLTVGGVLAPLGSDHVPRGVLLAYPYFHAEGWYWGAGFSRCDSMHFEVADETAVHMLQAH